MSLSPWSMNIFATSPCAGCRWLPTLSGQMLTTCVFGNWTLWGYSLRCENRTVNRTVNRRENADAQAASTDGRATLYVNGQAHM
jgi:hypothetical protein